MTLIAKATDYIYNIIAEDETVKRFPKEFVAEAALWIRSWFLKDDPKTEAKIKDINNPPDKKKGIIETKLEDLLEENETLKAEFEKRLLAFETQKTKRKGVVENSEIDAKGSVHIGDKGNVATDGYDEKNIIKGSTIKAGGDFHLGDNVFSGNEKVEITHHHYNNKIAEALTTLGITAEVEKLIAAGKTEKAIEVLLDAKGIEKDLQEQVLMQSGRMSYLNRQVNNGILTNEEGNTQRARINAALLSLVKEIKA
jgi:hypothetical protein